MATSAPKTKRPRLHVVGPVKVLCFGDAVAAGEPTPRGFRAEVAGDLEEFGIPFTFVGSQRAEAGYHDGYGGLTAAALLPKLTPALTHADPDVVLLHVGSADLAAHAAADDIAKSIEQMLDAVAAQSKRAKRPQPTHVLLASVVPRALPGGARDDDASRLNDRLQTLVAKRRSPPVAFVDLTRLMDAGRDYSDQNRPNYNGYHKIGRAFALALRDLVTGRP